MKIGDKFNLVIGFINNESQIEEKNIFTFSNIKIINEGRYNHHAFVTEKIKNIKPVNYNKYIPLTGYDFILREEHLHLLDYTAHYNCYFIFSDTLTEQELKKKFIEEMISISTSELEIKQKECNEIKKALENLKKLL